MTEAEKLEMYRTATYEPPQVNPAWLKASHTVMFCYPGGPSIDWHEVPLPEGWRRAAKDFLMPCGVNVPCLPETDGVVRFEARAPNGQRLLVSISEAQIG